MFVMLVYVWYIFMDVNFGLCRVFKFSLRNTRSSSYTRLKLLMMSCLRCNLVVIWSVSCMLSVLWKVLKGFVFVLFVCVCSTGVFIFKNSSSSSIRRMVEMMFECVLNVFCILGDMIKFMYCCWYCFFMFCNLCYLFGNGSSVFVNICILVGTMDSFFLLFFFMFLCMLMMFLMFMSFVIILNVFGFVLFNCFLL